MSDWMGQRCAYCGAKFTEDNCDEELIPLDTADGDWVHDECFNDLLKDRKKMEIADRFGEVCEIIQHGRD